jgi:hypothetical protein
MKKTLHCVFFLLAITLVPLQSVHALAIIADATGYNVGYVTDFWGVEFISGEGYITSVTFDVTSTGGYFDFDGSDFLDPLIPGVEPIIGATNGLSIGDIDFPRANGGAVGQLPLGAISRERNFGENHRSRAVPTRRVFRRSSKLVFRKKCTGRI